jgi:hypothetical protein
MRYYAPDDRTVVSDPAPELLEQVLRTTPPAYWQQGANGEAILDAGPDKPSLWIKQPEPGRFFVTYSRPPANWLVPFNGGSCEELVADERGGDPFLIPRACLIDTEQAVEVVRCFLTSLRASTVVGWRYWHDLPLPPEALRLSGGA